MSTYRHVAIKSFSNKKLEKFFQSGSKTVIQPHHAAKLARILDRLDSATDIKDMNYPGSGLHPLSGNLKQFWIEFDLDLKMKMLMM